MIFYRWWDWQAIGPVIGRDYRRAIGQAIERARRMIGQAHRWVIRPVEQGAGYFLRVRWKAQKHHAQQSHIKASLFIWRQR